MGREHRHDLTVLERCQGYDRVQYRGRECVRDHRSGKVYALIAGGVADATSFAAAVKEVYPTEMADLLPHDVALLKSAEKREKAAWVGKTEGLNVPIRVGRNQSFVFGQAGGPIGDAQEQGYENLRIPLRTAWYRIGLDHVQMQTARSNKDSFIRLVESEMKGARMDSTDNLNRAIWYDGRGVLAEVNTAGADSTLLIVKDPGGVTGTTNAARFLQRNQKVAILDSTGATVLCVRRITTIGNAGTNDGTRVTLNAAVSATQAPANGLVVLAPNLSVTEVNHTAYLKEPMGMLGMLDDGTYVNTYFGLNRQTFEVLKSAVIGSVGALNTDVIQQMIDTAKEVSHESNITEHWMHPSIRRSYLALLTATRRYLSTSGANKHDAGFVQYGETIEYGGSPVKVDADAPYGFWFGLDPEGLSYFPNTEFEWLDDDGAIMHRREGVAQFEAVGCWYGNFAHLKPNGSGVLSGITANIVVAHVP